jgi:predicted membrane channel-forming protein YqfA (hemolysin III family)
MEYRLLLHHKLKAPRGLAFGQIITNLSPNRSTMDRQAHEERLQRQTIRTRTIYSYVMGALWFGAGIFLLVNRVGLSVATGYDTGVLTFLGGLFVVYGSFRAWRGYRTGSVKQQ